MPAYIYAKPFISIAGTDFACFADSASLIPEDLMGDASTFCYPGLQIPSTLKTWNVSITFKQSYGASELWNQLDTIHAAQEAGTVPAWILRPNTAAVGADNPQAQFTGYMSTPHFMAAAPGQSMTWEMTTISIGDPVFTKA